jgi:hypothetical protein
MNTLIYYSLRLIVHACARAVCRRLQRLASHSPRVVNPLQEFLSQTEVRCKGR